MKALKKIFPIVCGCLFSAAFASAQEEANQTWYYAFSSHGDPEATQYYNIYRSDSTSGDNNITWNDSWANGYWYTLNSDGEKVWSSSVPEDFSKIDLVLGDNSYHTSENDLFTYLQLEAGETFTVGSVTLGGYSSADKGSRLFGYSSGNRGNIRILGDLKKSTIRSSFVNNAESVYVGGDIVTPGGNFAMTIGTLEVAGDIKSSNGGRMYMVAYGTSSSFSNPSIKIGGVIDSMMFYSKPSGSADNYIQVSGVTGSGSLMREAPANYSSQNGTSYYILTNATDYSATGAISERNGSKWTSEAGRVNFVMNGTASQSFTTNTAVFQGGVKVVSGGLYINFNQYARYNEYSYNNSDTNTVTAFTTNGGTTRAQFSHGDLEMGAVVDGLQSAGANAVFGSTEGSDSYGSFRFTNIIYNSGTIKLRLDSADKMDTLDLTSYALYNSEDSSWVDVAGGTLSFGASAAEGAKVTFDFGTNLEWLTQYDDSSDGVKIISWDVANKSGLSAEDFTANSYGAYHAQFAVNDDGLYVKYVVPEPADFAVLLGVACVLFAALRRRGR